MRPRGRINLGFEISGRCGTQELSDRNKTKLSHARKYWSLRFMFDRPSDVSRPTSLIKR